MGNISVSVDGTPVFDWKGDEASMKNIFEDFPRGAASVSMAPDELAQVCMTYLANLPQQQSPVGKEMQMMGVIWSILNQDTGHPDHPGRIADYAGTHDFDVDLHIGKQDVTARVLARGKFDA
jgi:hypothetical protein